MTDSKNEVADDKANTSKTDEAADKANASKITEDSSSEKENLEDSQDTKVEATSSDYFGEKEESASELETLKKRYGDSTREYQKLKEAGEKSRLALENLELLAQRNPKIFEEIKKAQETGQTGSVDSTFIQQEIDKRLEPIIKATEAIQRDREGDKIKVLNSFAKKNPKLFPPKATRETRKKMGKSIMAIADVLEKSGMDYAKAIKRAALSVNPQAAVQLGKDKAYLEMASADQAGFPSQVSDEGKRTKKGPYTPEQLQVAKEMNPKVYKAMLEKGK